jgi:hypothetical protein
MSNATLASSSDKTMQSPEDDDDDEDKDEKDEDDNIDDDDDDEDEDDDWEDNTEASFTTSDDIRVFKINNGGRILPLSIFKI